MWCDVICVMRKIVSVCFLAFWYCYGEKKIICHGIEKAIDRSISSIECECIVWVFLVRFKLVSVFLQDAWQFAWMERMRKWGINDAYACDMQGIFTYVFGNIHDLLRVYCYENGVRCTYCVLARVVCGSSTAPRPIVTRRSETEHSFDLPVGPRCLIEGPSNSWGNAYTSISHPVSKKLNSDSVQALDLPL